MMRTTMNPAERHNLLIAKLREMDPKSFGNADGILRAARTILPDAQPQEVHDAMGGLLSQLEEDGAVREAEKGALDALIALVDGCPEGMAVKAWADQLVAAGDARGQQILDALNHPVMPHEIELPAESETTLLDVAKFLVEWNDKAAGWMKRNRELWDDSTNESDLEFEQVTISFDRDGLNLFMKNQESAAKWLRVMVEAVEQLAREVAQLRRRRPV